MLPQQSDSVTLTREDFLDLAAKNERLRLALVTFQRDPHLPSTRGCGTCAKITDMLGEPFGCDAKRVAVKTGTDRDR